MIDGLPQQEQGWLAAFFSGRNALTWTELESGTAADNWAADMLPWLSLLSREDPELPLVLPCLNTDGSVVWYAGARSVRAAFRLGEELHAMVGPSYADFEGRPHVLDRSDPQQVLLVAQFVEPVFRLAPARLEDVPIIRRMLGLYRALLERRPPLARAVVRPLGAIRGDFDRALLTGNEAEARRLFEEMLRTGRLNAENRIFLEVRLLAGLGHWPQIASNPMLLRTLGDLPLPPQVLADVVEALYRVYAEPFEAQRDSDSARRHFTERAAARYGRLFATRRGVGQPRVLKAFLLYELAQPVPDPARCDELANLLGNTAADPFVADLLAQVPRPGVTAFSASSLQGPAANRAVLADEAFEDDQYDRALALYLSLPTTAKGLRRILRCAREIGTREAALQAIQVLEVTPEELTESLGATALETVERLRALVAGPVPEVPKPVGAVLPVTDWLSWARWVAAGAPLDEAEQAARNLSAMWSTASIASNRATVEELAGILGNAEGVAASVFNAVYPTLLETFLPDPERPLPIFKSLYATLLTSIALADAPSQDDLELAIRLAVSLLVVGTTVEEYRALVQDLEELLHTTGSVKTLGWAIDVAEILAIHPARDPEVRLRFFIAVLDMARTVAHRLTNAHRVPLDLLCKDFDVVGPVEIATHADDQEAAGDALRMALAGRKVAVYTLME